MLPTSKFSIDYLLGGSPSPRSSTSSGDDVASTQNFGSSNSSTPAPVQNSTPLYIPGIPPSMFPVPPQNLPWSLAPNFGHVAMLGPEMTSPGTIFPIGPPVPIIHLPRPHPYPPFPIPHHLLPLFQKYLGPISPYPTLFLTKYQDFELRKRYKQNQRISGPEAEKMGKKIKLEKTQIVKWFDDFRRRERKRIEGIEKTIRELQVKLFPNSTSSSPPSDVQNLEFSKHEKARITKFTDAQFRALREEFQFGYYIGKEEAEELSGRIGLTVSQVRNWFTSERRRRVMAEKVKEGVRRGL